MKAEELLRAMNDIDDSYIQAAAPELHEKPIPFFTRYRRALTLVASLAVVICLAGIGARSLYLKNAGSAVKTMAATDEESENSEEISETPMFAMTMTAESSADEGTDEDTCDTFAAEVQAEEEWSTFVADEALPVGASSQSSSSEPPEEVNGTSSEYEEDIELLRKTVPAELLFWNEQAFETDGQYSTEIPDGFEFESVIGAEEILSDNEILYGYPVYLSVEDTECFYVGYPDGYALYTLK